MSMSITVKAVLAASTMAVGAALPACAQEQPPAPVGSEPRLVVFITVDQLRESYLERYAGQLTGGLGRLLRGGAFFTNAYHDHAVTETAPGHSVTLAGRFPRGTGIVKNSAGVGDPQTPLIGWDGPGASPFRFRGSTLIDWMRTADPASRALSVSRKDRGAILPLGRAHQQVYWYTPGGDFTTSTYYADTLPGWVQRFNARHEPQSYAGKSWNLLLPASAYPERDSVPVESGGRDFLFPHVMPADSTAPGALANYPFMDQVTLDLALEGLEALELGADEHMDLLAVSLSTTDAIGHRFGPQSREIHDQVLRVDRMLGVFIDSIFRLRDSTRVVFALTGDHGVTPFAELRARTAQEARATHVDVRPFLTEFTGRLVRKGVPASAFLYESFMLTVDRRAFAAARVNVDSVTADFVARMRKVPGVARVEYTARLATRDTIHDAVARRWLHMLPPDLPIPVVVTLKPGYTGMGMSAEHGSPYDDDAHVPILFYGPPFAHGRFARPARVVDLAPTLAQAIGVSPTQPLDGRVLLEALRTSAGVAAARP